MEAERYSAQIVSGSQNDTWRRKCGCLRTSEKLKQLLDKFPAPPPPTPDIVPQISPCTKLHNTCISAYCTQVHNQTLFGNTDTTSKAKFKDIGKDVPPKKDNAKTWLMFREIVQLLQFSVTATALAVYYLIYCYMQVIYYTLWSAIYFHNADGPMKLTIGIVTITSLVIAFNLLMKFERFIGIGLFQ